MGWSARGVLLSGRAMVPESGRKYDNEKWCRLNWWFLTTRGWSRTCCIQAGTYMYLVSSSSMKRRWSYGEIIVDGRSANCLFTSSRAARCRSWHLLRTRYCIAFSAVARIRMIARHPVRRMPTDVTAAVRLIAEYSLKPRSCGC